MQYDNRPDFLRTLLGQATKIKCQNGAMIEGVLRAYDPYSLIVEIAGGEHILLFKHSILFIAGHALKEGGQNVRGNGA